MASDLNIFCPCCLEDSFDAIAKLQCNHMICLPCLEKFLNVDRFPKICPMCRERVSKFIIKGLDEKFDHYTLKIKTKIAEKLNLKLKGYEE